MRIGDKLGQHRTLIHWHFQDGLHALILGISQHLVGQNLRLGLLLPTLLFLLVVVHLRRFRAACLLGFVLRLAPVVLHHQHLILGGQHWIGRIGPLAFRGLADDLIRWELDQQLARNQIEGWKVAHPFIDRRIGDALRIELLLEPCVHAQLLYRVYLPGARTESEAIQHLNSTLLWIERRQCFNVGRWMAGGLTGVPRMAWLGLSCARHREKQGKHSGDNGEGFGTHKDSSAEDVGSILTQK